MIVRSSKIIVVDGSAVTHIATAGLQLLAAFVSGRSALQSVVNWADISPILLNAAELGGLSSAIRIHIQGDRANSEQLLQ